MSTNYTNLAEYLGGIAVIGAGLRYTGLAIWAGVKTFGKISDSLEKIAHNDLPHLEGEIRGLNQNFTNFLIQEAGKRGQDTAGYTRGDSGATPQR